MHDQYEGFDTAFHYDPGSFGVISVAYGGKAHAAARRCAEGLQAAQRKSRYIPLAVVTDDPAALVGEDVKSIKFDEIIKFDELIDRGARRAKLNIIKLTPWDYNLYLDADTIPQLNIEVGFQMLYDGWDLVIVPSQQQDHNSRFWHIGPEERQYTYETVGYTPTQLQGGVFYFKASSRVEALFEEWRNQWELYQDQDQAALIRALHRMPIKVWMLGQPFNNGAVIAHKFGSARR